METTRMLPTIFHDDSLEKEWLLNMVSLGYLTPKEDGGYAVTEKVRKQASLRDDFITRTIVDSLYEFSYNELDPTDIYYRKRNTDDPFIRFPYDKKQLKDKIVLLYRTFFKMTSHKETEACANNILDNITQVADLSNGLWYAGKDLFWDSENNALISHDGLNGRDSYREIGSTSRDDAVDPAIVKETFDYWSDLLATKTTEHGDFENFYESLPIEHDHLKLWACVGTEGGVDRYWDLCVAISTIFMYSPPPVVYIPKGKPRGGKSTLIKHLHYLVGDWQTSSVQMSQLADPHFNNLLYGSVFNAPDEDKSGDLNADVTAIFKSLAAKEQCTLAVLYSTKPKKITLKIPMFFPRNVLPDFGTESAACMKRLRFIFCNADLSEYDKKPVDFIKVTFKDHPDYLAKYVGFLLALSAYFSEHGMWYSNTMQRSSDFVSEFVNSSTLYYNTWKKYFAGYESFDLLWEDYKNFCSSRGCKVEGKEVLREAFSLEAQNRVKKYYPGVKKDIWMYLTNAKYGKGLYDLGYHILCKDEFFANIGAARERVLDGASSMVDMLDTIAKDAEAAFAGEKK